MMLSALAFSRPAAAQCTNCLCQVGETAAVQAAVQAGTNATEQAFDQDFASHKTNFMPNDFFGGHAGPGLKGMATQFTTAGLVQMMAIGAFLDAKHQLETQRLFQQKTSQAHKDYQTSTEMCTIGTAANGLGSAYRNGEATAIILANHARGRQMFAENSSSNQGAAQDVVARLMQFQKRYCDPHDNNLSEVCEQAAPSISVNKDIDYTRTIDLPLTIQANFNDSNNSDDEQDVLALGSNLYAHQLFTKVEQEKLNQPGNQPFILDWRSVLAKRSVAENSYNALVGMKTADNAASAENAKYLAVVLQQLGASQTDAAALIGTQPSYYARMELLTKKIYQQPEFYTALYDTPANVARKGAALRAIDLMQHMDMFNSQLRHEAMVAGLVELDLVKEQSRVQNYLSPVPANGQ